MNRAGGQTEMYAEHFGFSKLPFSVAPDPEVFFCSPVYREAFAKLQYGVLEKKGFVLITGEVGTGKTTLLRKLLHSLGPTVHSVFIFNTQVSFVELLRLILDDLGLTHQNADKLSMIEILNRYLIERLKQGNIVALLIDEAQNLDDDALEGLRLLSNLETDTQKLLQIVVMGQPELEAKLDQPKLRQLKQRILLQCRLVPLKKEDVAAYIQLRLNAAGYRGKHLFDHSAIEAIAHYSKGIPRLVNVICDNALVAAVSDSKKKVSARIVEQLAQDLRLGSPRPVEARRSVHRKMPDNTVKPLIPPPEFENVFIDAEKGHRAASQWKHTLTSWGAGTLVVAVFLGGIAVAYTQQDKINLWDLAAPSGAFYREDKGYFSSWAAGVNEFFQKTADYLADSAVKAQDLSTQSKNYLDSKAGDFYRQSADYLATSVNNAEDFSRRSKDSLAGLAARMAEAVRLHWKPSEQIKPMTKLDEEKSSGSRRTESKSANSMVQAEPIEHASPVAEKPAITREESTDFKGETNSPSSPAVQSDEAQIAKKPEPAIASLVRPETSQTPSAESQQVASAKQEPPPLEHPNEEQGPYSGNFEVVDNSFVRDKPQDDAKIVTTLKPGTAIRVESKTGKYFQIQSLNRPEIHGYVHEEDAFFKRVKS